MRMVVKIAGALLERDEDVQTLARQIAELARAGHEILVVHGGGKIFTATLARMGITSRFISGLRVTDRETRDVAVMVFGGLLEQATGRSDLRSQASRPSGLAPRTPAVSWRNRCNSRIPKALWGSSAI